MVKPYLVQDLIIEDCLISIVSDDLPESFFNYNIKGNRLRLNYREDIMILESELDGSDIVFCFPDKSLCISKSYPVQSQEVHDYVWRVDQGIIHSRGGQLISNNLLW